MIRYSNFLLMFVLMSAYDLMDECWVFYINLWEAGVWTSSQAKGTKSTALNEVDLVPLACKDGL